MLGRQIADWIQDRERQEGYWVVKRLSRNDTQATGGHQAGPYIPRRAAFAIFPDLNQPAEENPSIEFSAEAGSHQHRSEANIIWYNNQLVGRTRNETRMTGFGGAASPLLDPDNAGAVALFFFTHNERGQRVCLYWVCRNAAEETEAHRFAGRIIRGQPRYWQA